MQARQGVAIMYPSDAVLTHSVHSVQCRRRRLTCMTAAARQVGIFIRWTVVCRDAVLCTHLVRCSCVGQSLEVEGRRWHMGCAVAHQRINCRAVSPW